jgi:DNA-binding response OmpR family regulator
MLMNSSRVLVVEDDVGVSRLLSKELTEGGFSPVVATTLDDAFRLLDDRPFCVLLDLDLPDISGVEVLRQVRRLELPIKVAVVTGSADFSTFGFAVLLGPDAIFRKPVNSSELLAWVASADRSPLGQVKMANTVPPSA